jgi:hypothetical protein
MKKLFLMACILSWAASAMAAGFPVFFGGTLDYMTNGNQFLSLSVSNQFLLRWERGSGTSIFTNPAASSGFVIDTVVRFPTLVKMTSPGLVDGALLGLHDDGSVTNAASGYGVQVVAPLTLETVNRVTGQASAATLQLDFSTTDNTYEITNLASALTIQITNWTHGRDKWVYIRTDGTPRAITVSTNGSTIGISVRWGFTSITNGATAVTATNRMRMNFACLPVAEVAAAYEYQQ